MTKKGRQIFNIQALFGISLLQLKAYGGEGLTAVFPELNSSPKQVNGAEVSLSLAPLLKEGSVFARQDTLEAG